MMKTKSNKLKKFFLVLSIIIGIIFLSLTCLVLFFYNKYDLDTNKLTSFNNGIKVYSASGNDSTLYNTNRSIVDINTLPTYVKDAFIDTEDKRFYSHNGYDLKRIIKSALVNIASGSKSQGASTISQQLIKNALLTNEKTYSRKIQEVFLSIKMEKTFSKEEILEMYLNTIYFGSNAYGIENASKIYFNKSAKDLTLNEACCLAGLIKSPGAYSPKTNYENFIKRKNQVAKNMLEMNNISLEEYKQILESPIVVYNNNTKDNSYEKEAIYEACTLLNLTERDIINREYQIITFKNDDLQKQVVESNNKIINQSEDLSKTSLDSLSVVANNNGQVLAYYANSNYNLHNLKRQPASTLKPLAVYLPAFQHNILSPSSLILDEAINYNGFSPQNADKKYRGYVSCREALSQSLNIPAVKTLDFLGVKKSKECLESLGINITNSDLNLSLSLGAVKNGVDLMSLLSAYMTIANYGNHSTLCFVDKILDKSGNVIYSHENYKTKVIDEASCFLVTDILKDCSTTGTSKRFESLNIPIASKTGTASVEDNNTDLFNIAYTTEHTMLTWIADIDKATLPNSLLSSSQPTEINKNICSYLYEENKPIDFPIPATVEKCAYDLVEMETNHIIVQPNHNIQRYIAYDYFQVENKPNLLISDDLLDFDLKIDKSAVNIDFQAKKNMIYNIYKSTNNVKTLLATIKEENGFITIKDADIFKHFEIEYYICNANNEIISEIKKIRPQDYLINMLNNEIISSKKQWLV